MNLGAIPTESALTATESVITRSKRVLLQNYRQQPLVIVRGEGAYVWDVEGRRYLDLIAGIATCILGHCHPAVIEAARRQLDKLWHVSNAFFSEPQLALAERLTSASGLPGAVAFFCNSGAEANEALIKLARRYQRVCAQSNRFEIITFEGGFHGRTLATVAATGQAKYQNGFEPLPAGFVYAPYGDLDAVKQKINAQTAAILIEPIQGEGGVRPAPKGFLPALKALCERHGILLLIDEVQTGIGRTGRPFAFQHEGVVPDAFSLAKALGNGFPIGAMVCSAHVAHGLSPGTHGSTFGGNPIAAAVACATWDLATAPEVLQENQAKGAYLHSLGEALQMRHSDRIKDVRGRGLLFGIEFDVKADDILAKCRGNGLLANLAGEKTIRFAPGCMISREQLKEGFFILERSL